MAELWLKFDSSQSTDFKFDGRNSLLVFDKVEALMAIPDRGLYLFSLLDDFMPPIIQVWKEGKIAKEVYSIAMLNDTDEYIHAIMSIGCKSGFVNKEVTETRSKLVRIKKD